MKHPDLRMISWMKHPDIHIASARPETGVFRIVIC